MASLGLTLLALVSVWPLVQADGLIGSFAVLVIAVWALVGYLVLRDPTRRQLGWLLLICALLWSMQFAEEWAGGPSGIAAVVGKAAFWIIGAWVVFSYPSDLPRVRSERWFLWVFGAYMGSTSLLAMVTSQPAWLGLTGDIWWLAGDGVRLVHDINTGSWVPLDLIASAAFLVLVIRRIARMPALDRADSAVLLIGYSGLALVSAFRGVDGGWYGIDADAALLLSIVALCIPTAFVAADIRYRRSIGVISQSLHRQFATTIADIDEIESALRGALGDPSIRLRLSDDSGDGERVAC